MSRQLLLGVLLKSEDILISWYIFLPWFFSGPVVFAIMLLCWSCCHKLPLTWWLNDRSVFSHGSGSQSPKSVTLSRNQGVGRDTLLLEALGERLFLSLPAYGDCQAVLARWPSLQPLSGHSLLLSVLPSSVSLS